MNLPPMPCPKSCRASANPQDEQPQPQVYTPRPKASTGQTLPAAERADLPGAQAPSVVAGVNKDKFKAGPNVELSGARQRVRLNEMLDTAPELATNARPVAFPRQRPRGQQHTAPARAGQRTLRRHRPKRHR